MNSGASFQEVVERRYADGDAAIKALRGGQVDVVDRLRPWDVSKLAASGAVVVEPYAFPTVHFLLVNPARRWVSNAQVRRALAYGIDRERIVRDELLAGETGRGERTENGRVLPGPFPTGYAHDNALKALPYDPRLALALFRSAQAEVAAATGRQVGADEPLPGLVLGYPANEVARVTCRAIQQQLAGAGIVVELRESADDGRFVERRDFAFHDHEIAEFDLTYVEWPAMEPLVDAAALFGPGSMTQVDSPQISSALWSLETADDWPSASQALHELERAAQHELAVVPLWQLTEHMAYRREVTGIGPRPVTLYQRVEHWSRP
jgi:ABC-type transport system substrate-binding protein